MNMNQIFTMLSRLVMRRAMNWGLNKGISTFAGKGKPGTPMTPQDRQLANKGRENAKLARKAARITRRMGR